MGTQVSKYTTVPLMSFRNITAGISANTFFVILEYEHPSPLPPIGMKMKLFPGKCTVN